MRSSYDGVREAMTSRHDHLIRLVGPSLCPSKFWYAVTKQLCGVKPTDFAKNEIFQRFPSEIQCVPTEELRTVTSEDQTKCINKQPRTYVATTFGFIVGILRQREIKDKTLLMSTSFKRVFEAINGVELENESGANFFGGNDTNNTAVNVHNVHNPSPSVFLTPPQDTSTPRSHRNLDDSIEKVKGSVLGKTTKKRKINSLSHSIMSDVDSVLMQHKESLACVFGNGFIYGKEEQKESIRSTISDTIDIVVNAVGTKKGFTEILQPELLQKFYKSMRVPDWMLLLFKLQARLPDAAWQTMLNITHLGRSGRNTDTPVLLTKNEIKAIKQMVFSLVRKTFTIQFLPTEFSTCGVNLKAVLVWAARENHIFITDDTTDDRVTTVQQLEFNIKIDGRPLGGRDQVAVGIVPINFSMKSSESALSVFPIAIANCKENRGNLKQLIRSLNEEKDAIKREGLKVDGITYLLKFTVTLDLKALLLLLEKKDDETFVLGGKGFDTEFCAFCDAVRACTAHGANPDETCYNCLRSKANIGRSCGLRDDLTCLLEEDLSHINLCSLHCEMRNLEQLLGSLGLFCHRVGTLHLLNEALSNYGPEVSRGFARVTIKERPGQQTAIEKHNIKVASFSGCTERQILNNIESIIRTSLPTDKVPKNFSQSSGASKQTILDYVTFLCERKNFSRELLDKRTFMRDYGTHQETVNISDVPELEAFLLELEMQWKSKEEEVSSKFILLANVPEPHEEPKQKRKKKNHVKKNHVQKTSPGNEKMYAHYAAELEIEFFVKVCTDWSNIAITMREEVFDKDDEQLIDIHDVKCKEWGFLLKKLFGIHLGTGDYGHLTIDHSAMLLRQFRSMYKYSGQGFESSHKLHRQLFAKATNHDSSGPAQSLDQILTHWYSMHMLSTRYLFRQARDILQSGKTKFTFRGCGWKACKGISLKENQKHWVNSVDDLFSSLFGGDHLRYKFDKEKGTSVTEDVISALITYDHEDWEMSYKKDMPKTTAPMPETTASMPKTTATMPETTAPMPKTTAPMSETTAPMPKTTIPMPKTTATMPETTAPMPKTTATMPETTAPMPKTTTPLHHSIIVNPSNCLSTAVAAAHTRADLTAIQSILPPIHHLSSRVKPINGPFVSTNPYCLATRPPMTVIEKAEKLFQKDRPLGVEITSVGMFKENDIVVLRKFCDVVDTAKKISAEATWLQQVGCTASEFTLLGDALWHKSANFPLLRLGKKTIDVSSFSDLAQERYIDNFVIDVCIGKYLDEARDTCIGMETTLYLPTELYEWMATGDDDFKKRQLATHTSALPMDHLTQMLIPVHMPMHWGLVYVDLQNKSLFFDDGMHIHPPNTILPCIKKTLDVLSKMHPTSHLLQQPFWHSCNSFSRFGMPSQELLNNSNMIGTGSCGVGIIMSAKDFIFDGSHKVNNIQWRYSNMHIYRKELMLQIVKWSNQ